MYSFVNYYNTLDKKYSGVEIEHKIQFKSNT